MLVLETTQQILDVGHDSLDVKIIHLGAVAEVRLVETLLAHLGVAPRLSLVPREPRRHLLVSAPLAPKSSLRSLLGPALGVLRVGPLLLLYVCLSEPGLLALRLLLHIHHFKLITNACCFSSYVKIRLGV